MTTYQEVKEWRKKNKEKVREQNRRYAKKHPETGKKSGEKYRNKNLISVQEKDKLRKRKKRIECPESRTIRYKRWREKKEIELTKIAGSTRPSICQLCNSEKYRIVFDHCHIKGCFRGWICDQCNKVLGLVQDSVMVLQRMISYLENDNGKINIQSKEETTS